VDHVCEVLLSLNSVAPKIRGVTIVDQPPALRHFTEKRASAAGRMIEA
jgi:tryptophanase